MRDPKTDKAIEERFGKPDWNRSLIIGDEMYTPIGNYPLLRVDPAPGILTNTEDEL